MLLKLPDQPLQVVETSEKYFMNATQPYIGIGNMIQYLYQDGTEFNLAVDEEGLIKRLPLNFSLRWSQRTVNIFNHLLDQWSLPDANLSIPEKKKYMTLR